MNVSMDENILPQKRYYSIGELASYFRVNTSLLRFWEKEFDILRPKKNAKGNRMFTPQDVKHLQTIFYLVKQKGYTLDGAKEYLKNSEKPVLSIIEIIQKLESIKQELTQIKNNL